MSIDINTLSAKELESLISQAKKRKTVLNKRKPLATVRTRLMRLIKAEGYTVAELFGPGPRREGAEGRQGPAQERRQGRAEVPQSGQPGRNLDRPRQAAALDGRADRAGPQGRGFPDQVIRADAG